MNKSEQKILHLTLRKKWFDMILSGKKQEEYREIKKYWNNRLLEGFSVGCCVDGLQPKKFDVVVFKNGYQKNAPSMVVELKSISTGEAKPEWSENWKGKVFKIKLGVIISTKNCN